MYKRQILGHEFSGVVAELGSPCEGIKPGDKVCAHILEYCGRCDACKKGFHNLCRSLKVLGTQSDGTFAEYVKVGIDKLFRLPDDADLRVYALAEPLAVGVYATDRIGVALADTALVIGAGPIGLCCAFAARKAGASRVVLSEVVLEKIEFARSLGFEVIDVGSQDLLAAAEAYTDGVGFDPVSYTHLDVYKRQVCENIFLGHEAQEAGIIHWGSEYRRTQELKMCIRDRAIGGLIDKADGFLLGVKADQGEYRTENLHISGDRHIRRDIC